MQKRESTTKSDPPIHNLPCGNKQNLNFSTPVFNQKMFVASVGITRVKLRVDCCSYKMFSMKNLTEDEISWLRKNIGFDITATIGYDPWHSSFYRSYWKLVGVK